MTTLPARFWAKVNKTDTCWLWTGGRSHNGYGHFKVDGRTQRCHRLVFADTHGEIPTGMQVDHVCFVKACVNPCHLRLATNKQNNEHRVGAQSTSATGARGVTPTRWGTYVARIRHNDRRIYLGSFKTVAEARAAHDAAARQLFTHY